MLTTVNPPFYFYPEFHKYAALSKTNDESGKLHLIQRPADKRLVSDCFSDLFHLGNSSSTGINGVPLEERVAMKLDVSHTEHSHLIGRGGNCVKNLMLETACHVHFPDSNRAPNVVEKSNQVSVSGRPEDVERARKRIRQMLPLVFIFPVPNTTSDSLSLYRNSCVVQLLEANYPVEVTYRHHYAYPLADLVFRHCAPSAVSRFAAPPVPNTCILASVRGLTSFAGQVMEATNLLLEHHFGGRELPNVWLTLDVEPKHQLSILSLFQPRSLTDIIHKSTGAFVWFAHENPLNSVSRFSLDCCHCQISPRRGLGNGGGGGGSNGFYAPRLCQSSVSCLNPSVHVCAVTGGGGGGANSFLTKPEARTMIVMYGSVEGCVSARQIIMTHLPVSLIAEVSTEEAVWINRLDLNAIKKEYNVCVSLRPKTRTSNKQSMVLKTPEHNVNMLYTVLASLKMIVRSKLVRSSFDMLSRVDPACLEEFERLSINPGTQLEPNVDVDLAGYRYRVPTNLGADRAFVSLWRDRRTSRSSSPESQFVTPVTQSSLESRDTFSSGWDQNGAPMNHLATAKDTDQMGCLNEIFDRFSLASKNPETTDHLKVEEAHSKDVVNEIRNDAFETFDWRKQDGDLFKCNNDPMWSEISTIWKRNRDSSAQEEPHILPDDKVLSDVTANQEPGGFSQIWNDKRGVNHIPSIETQSQQWRTRLNTHFEAITNDLFRSSDMNQFV